MKNILTNVCAQIPQPDSQYKKFSMKDNFFTALLISFLILFLIYHSGYSQTGLVVNEICAANDSILADKDGDYPDWIELYNGSQGAVNLLHYSLTDSKTDSNVWTFPEVLLESNGFIVIFCSGKDRSGAELHTNFKLSAGGEYLALLAPDGSVVDSLTFPELKNDHSFSRFPDGGSFFETANVTPGAPNAVDSSEIVVAPPTFSRQSGYFNAPIEVALTAADTTVAIYFTTDGSLPDQNSSRYRQPIPIDSSVVLRARALTADGFWSKAVAERFFLNQPYALKNFPVLQIVTDPENLWDKNRGIYANPTMGGDEWERPATVIFMEPQARDGFNVDAGLRIHGGASRKRSDKHSFRLYFRSEYGPGRLEYPIIPSADVERFDRLILRAGYNDSWTHGNEKQRLATTYLRDQLVRDIFIELGYPAAHGDFAHLYLNNQYWGLFNICERYDDEFFDDHVERAPWDVIKPGPDETKNALETTDGTMTAWNEFEKWYTNANFADSTQYDELMTWVYFDNLLDFYLVNVWAQNSDWPRHNWYAARPNEENGKWIFLPWDAEYCFGGGAVAFRSDYNMLDRIESQIQYPLNLLLFKLTINEKFRSAVLLRLDQLLASVLSVEHLDDLLSKRANQIQTAIPYESERWGQLYAPEYSYGVDEWNAALDSTRKFFRERTQHVLSHFEVAFGQISPPDSDSTGSGVFFLHPPFPNPFHESTLLQFVLPSEGKVSLSIYNARGQKIKQLVNGQELTEGEHTIAWEGDDDAGAAVASGLYFVRINWNGFEKTSRLVLLR